jgi:hypothetical protein
LSSCLLNRTEYISKVKRRGFILIAQVLCQKSTDIFCILRHWLSTYHATDQQGHNNSVP